MPARLPVEREPRHEPNEIEPPRGDERPAPAQREGDPRDEHRGEHDPDVRARVEDPGGQGPLALREPRSESTRLNSSHGYISYAVFCLKKKKKELPADHRH